MKDQEYPQYEITVETDEYAIRNIIKQIESDVRRIAESDKIETITKEKFLKKVRKIIEKKMKIKKIFKVKVMKVWSEESI